ncbi:MAG: hypothetical protein C0404_12590 [Verrucomicrobia bacterium]|nr:hypothetical protein [Verrucomicrobiota bacterium]
MRILDRYILREYLTYFAYCLVAFSMIFIVFDLSGEISKMIQSKTPFIDILVYYVFAMGPTLEYIMPASLLFATLYTLWQLTRNNELEAMRANGVSLTRIMMPFLGVGLAATVFIWVMKETINPSANMWTDDFRDNRYKSNAQSILTDKSYFNRADLRLWRIDKIDLRRPSKLIGVKLQIDRADGTRDREIFASKAEWLDGQWWFWDVQIRHYDKLDHPVTEMDLQESETHGPREMAFLGEKPSDLLNQIKKKWEYLSSREMLTYLRHNKSLSPKTIAELTYNLYNRTAMPWACLIVTFFAIPVGARTGRQDVLTGIFMAMAFFIGYYALSNAGMFLAMSNVVWPFIGAWLSNIVFLATGIVMATRMR